MWTHNYEPIAGSLGVSALVAAIPIFVLFYMLGIRRTTEMERDAVGLALDLGMGMVDQELRQPLVPGFGPSGLWRMSRTAAPFNHGTMLGNGIEIGRRQIGSEVGKRPAADDGDGPTQENLQAHQERRQFPRHRDGGRTGRYVDERTVEIEKERMAGGQTRRGDIARHCSLRWGLRHHCAGFDI